MPDPATPILELLDADITSVRSDLVKVIGGVNWRVSRGDFWVVGSRPGAGKTALFQSIAGIHRPLRGELRLFGRPLAGLPEHELLPLRLRLSLVFEGGGRLFQHLTVGENVALPYCYHHECSWAAAADQLAVIMKTTGLADWAYTHPTRLPRALGPRVGLARALMTTPEALLLDNPLRGLEATEQTWWQAMLAKLNQEAAPLQERPLTLVIAVEDLRPWVDLGSHFALIHKNEFLTLGGRQEVGHNSAGWPHDLLAPPAAIG